MIPKSLQENTREKTLQELVIALSRDRYFSMALGNNDDGIKIKQCDDVLRKNVILIKV